MSWDALSCSHSYTQTANCLPSLISTARRVPSGEEVTPVGVYVGDGLGKVKGYEPEAEGSEEL